jgi:hypothetical protein
VRSAGRGKECEVRGECELLPTAHGAPCNIQPQPHDPRQGETVGAASVGCTPLLSAVLCSKLQTAVCAIVADRGGKQE